MTDLVAANLRLEHGVAPAELLARATGGHAGTVGLVAARAVRGVDGLADQ